MSGSTKTCARSARSGSRRTVSRASTSSAVASLARTFPAPGRAQALKAADPGSGRSTPGSSAKSDLVGSSLRTSLLSAVAARIKFSATWKQQVTPHGRSWWVLSMPGRRTGDSGPGLWPTPNATEPDRSPKEHLRRSRLKAKQGIHLQLHLSTAVLWPTPTSYDATPGGPGNHYHGLAHQARWPTPTGTRRTGLQSHGRNEVPGTLNPMWVEWLMGFPPGWTDCAASATPLSRKSSR